MYGINTVGDLLEALRDLPEDTPISLGLQPNYPMSGSIQNVCIERDKEDEPQKVWIACSGNQGYEVPHEIWDDSEIYPDEDED